MPLSSSLEQALLDSLQPYRQQMHGKRLWLACSGGRDSLSLAYVCLQLFDTGRLPALPQLLHVNHGMQAANKEWAQHVAHWADQYNLPCKVLTVNLNEYNEQAARQARYSAIMQHMNKDDVLMLGHHQDDQVETVLMRLFKGTGVAGLGGMHTWSTKTCATSTKKIMLWRPWLGITRAQISDYAHYYQLDYIDDPTNLIFSANAENEALTINDRAWMRSVLLPTIEARYPLAREAIARSTVLMQEAHSTLTAIAQTDLKTICANDGYSQTLQSLQSIINISKLHALPVARQSAVLHTWLSPSPIELTSSKQVVDDVLALSQRCDTNHQTLIEWDSGRHRYHIRRYQNQVYRMRTEWVDWLSIGPSTQYLTDILYPPVNSQRTPVNVLSLKPYALGVSWQLRGVLSVIALMHKYDSDSDQIAYNLEQTSPSLCFEPLPRTLKVALAGRQGRKSGKKLLQAINQPPFMRSSVVVCSLVQSLNERIHINMDHSPATLPLFIITLNSIYLLQSRYTASLASLISNDILSVSVTI